MINRTPVYNLMVVLKETGLKADVLRAWERRYDVPHPQRTAGGHRLYSNYDIATIKWLKNRQAEGMSISHAVQLWKDLLANGRDPLMEAVESKGAPIISLADGMSVASLRQRWLDGCLAFDAAKGEEALDQAFALYPVENACSAILRQGLNLIGEEWYLGRVSVQQEHFTSSLAIRRLETLISAAPQQTHPQTVLMGCPMGELHTFPAIMLSLFLQRKGMKVVYLGADNPLEHMDAAIEAIHPDLVVLSAQQLVTAASLALAARAIQRVHIPAAYGGLIFNRVPELRQRIAGTFLGESIEAATDKIELLIRSPAYPAPIEVDEKSKQLAQDFRLTRPLIEQELYAAWQRDGVKIETFEEINAFFSSRVAAALDLGDPGFLEGELNWIAGLLTSHNMQAAKLLTYLVAYRNCVHAILGEGGNPLTQWIDQYVALQ